MTTKHSKTALALTVGVLALLCWLATVIADQRQQLRGERAARAVAEERVTSLESWLRTCAGSKRLLYALDETQRKLDGVWQR